MTPPTDDTTHPGPDPQRVEAALIAMRVRRARMRRVRAIATAGAVTVLLATAGGVYAGVKSGNSRNLRVAGETSTTTAAPPGSTTTTLAPTTSSVATTTTTAPVTGTREITYQPFTAAGVIDPALRVTGNDAGTCVSGESTRSFRCFGGSAIIYDPCFAGPNGAAAPFVCPSDPTTGAVTEFTAAQGGPSVTTVTDVRPWAIELGTGQICEFVSAATTRLGPFNCLRDTSLQTVADCAEPDSTPPWWTAECEGSRGQASPPTQYQVTKVWF